jgi:hypothetical protein
MACNAVRAGSIPIFNEFTSSIVSYSLVADWHVVAPVWKSQLTISLWFAWLFAPFFSYFSGN